MESRLAYHIQELANGALPINIRKMLVEASAKHYKIKTVTGRANARNPTPRWDSRKEKGPGDYSSPSIWWSSGDPTRPAKPVAGMLPRFMSRMGES